MKERKKEKNKGEKELPSSSAGVRLTQIFMLLIHQKAISTGVELPVFEAADVSSFTDSTVQSKVY